MCSRGVFQLRKLSIFFCDFGGSSTGIRDTITSNQFKTFMQDNSQIDFNFICKRNNHPFIRSAYINGYLKDISLRNKNPQQIAQVLKGLKNQMGRKSLKANGSRVYRVKQSIQGKWEPNMFHKYPKAELEKIYEIEKMPVDMKEVEVESKRNKKEKDMVTQLLKMKEFTNPHQRQQ